MKIDLKCAQTSPLTPEMGLYLITRVWEHVLYGPEKLTIRSNALTAIRNARFQILSGMAKHVRDAHVDDY